jgi:hypothetical protein
MTLPELVIGESQESETLDFKTKWWTAGGASKANHEAAKDLAAFANHRGGAIVVGAMERPGPDGVKVLSGYFREPLETLPPSTRELERWLAEATTHLSVAPVFQVRSVPVEDYFYYLVIVQPSAVAVLLKSGSSSHYYSMPVRTVTGTRYVESREMEERMTDSHRRWWLLLRSAHDSQTAVRLVCHKIEQPHIYQPMMKTEFRVLDLNETAGFLQATSAEGGFWIPLSSIKHGWREGQSHDCTVTLRLDGELVAAQKGHVFRVA